MLWNVSTGELLLSLANANTMTSIAYSGTGDSLAVGSLTAHGSPGSTWVFDIQESRGQQLMRGLRSRVAQVRISAKNRIVAALTDNFQLAVWDLKSHRLLHVIQIPIGVYATSAGLAIDTEERLIAVVTGKEANVWEIESGTNIKSVPLPPGYAESLEFQNSNTLISARQESVDPNFPPVGRNIYPETSPRVCRVRNLLAVEPERPILTIADFKRSAASINVTASCNRLLIEGYDEGGTVPEHRSIKLFELPSGKQLWEMRSDARGANAYRIHSIDSTGRVVAMAREEMDGQILVDLESGIQIRQNAATFLHCLGPKASTNVSSAREPDPPHRPFLAIVQGEKSQELLRVGLIKSVSDGIAVSTDERFFVYGCSDGSVVVTDLWSVQKKLAEVGLN
jgi:WD40 repeat protein